MASRSLAGFFVSRGHSRMTPRTPPAHPPSLSLSFLPLVAVVASMVSGCGSGLFTPEGAPAPPLFLVQANLRGALAADFSGELRGALAWGVYSDELIDCLDGVMVDRPLDYANDEEDYATALRVLSCRDFSERGRIENASVPIEAQLPSRFTIPVGSLPAPSVLSGETGAYFGIAEVVVYADDNGNSILDETPLGADAFVDRVVGTSRSFADFGAEGSWIIYREGELSPVWKLFRALWGCPDPAPGFSRLHIDINDLGTTATCALDQEPIDVVLRDDIEGLGCAFDPESYVMQRAITSEGWSADSVGVCELMYGYDDEDHYDLYLTESWSSVCPSFRRLTLVGCSDTSSPEACEATAWDDLGDAPAWWPCKFSDGTRLSFLLEDPVNATDGNDEALFELFWSDGLGSAAPSRIAVILDDETTPAADLTLDAAGFTLVDQDENGVFNAGDRLVVGETANQLTTQTPPGAYRVRLIIDGVEVAPNQARYYEPVAPPPVALIDTFSVDAAAATTDGIDELVIITHFGAEDGRSAFAFSDITASVLVGGELPLPEMSLENGALIFIDDVDRDGLFESGDSLLLRDPSTEPFQQVSPEVTASFGNNLDITLFVKTGVNTRAPFGYASVTVE